MTQLVLPSLWQTLRRHRPDRVWVAILLVAAGVAVLARPELPGIVRFALGALVETSPYILAATLLIAGTRATGAETVIAHAFRGRELRVVLFASLAGTLAPFCSCEVIPLIALLLASGVPLSGIMAFWLASPIMDPPMFVITMSTLGLDFALGKTLAALGFGLAGGGATMLLCRAGLLAAPLRPQPETGCCDQTPATGRPVWKFWREAGRRAQFRATAVWNLHFLGKWMTLAYLLEAILIEFVPSGFVASLLGGEGLQPVVLGALLGAPAYLNGYAALPVVAGMVAQGMSQGAAMSFVLAGSVTCIPAAVAVWALVRREVFGVYLLLALLASLFAGLLWELVV